MKASDLKQGKAVDIDGQIWLVTSHEHVKPGKGPAYSQVKLKNLINGTNIDKRLRSSEEVNQVDLDRRDIEYLYSDNTGAVFMDIENYEQFPISESVLDGKLGYIKPNTAVKGLVYNGNVLAVELPAAVDLAVADTPPGIKNATATNQLKEATLETGLKSRVPPFINNGDVVRISTDTGDYISRQETA